MADLWFAETNARRIEAAVITGYEAAAQLAGIPNYKLYPGDPRRLFLEAIALLLAQQNAVIDLTGKSNLLRYAGEATIADLGWLYGPRGDRLQPSHAITTIEFTLSAARNSVTTVPGGTRLTTGSLVFQTAEPLDIPAGELTGRVAAICDTPGPEANGMLPGQIMEIIDRGPFVEKAINVTESAGGANVEDIEAYRERIRNLPESFSVAGPDGAYWFWAKTANPGIIDVAVWSPEPGHVNVVPLMEGGELPTQDILDAVYDIMSDKTKRPLTDFVHVIDPEPIDYDVTITYWIERSNAPMAVAIQTAVTAAVSDYLRWQSSRLGLDIIPDELTRRVMEAGARRVDIASPVFTLLQQGQVAQAGTVTVSYGGLEDA